MAGGRREGGGGRAARCGVVAGRVRAVGADGGTTHRSSRGAAGVVVRAGLPELQLRGLRRVSARDDPGVLHDPRGGCGVGIAARGGLARRVHLRVVRGGGGDAEADRGRRRRRGLARGGGGSTVELARNRKRDGESRGGGSGAGGGGGYLPH